MIYEFYELLVNNLPMKLLLLLLVTLIFAQRQIKIQSFNIETLDQAKYQLPNVANIIKDFIYNGDVTLIQGNLNSQIMNQISQNVQDRYIMVNNQNYQYLFYKSLVFDLNFNSNLFGNFRNTPQQFLLNQLLLVGYMAAIDFSKTTQEVQELTKFNYNATQVLILGDFTCQFNPNVVNSTLWKFTLSNTSTLVSSNCGSDRFLVNNILQNYVVTSKVSVDYAMSYNYSVTDLTTISSHFPIEINILIPYKRGPFWIELVTLSSVFGGLLVCVGLLIIIGFSLRIQKSISQHQPNQYQELQKEIIE